MESLYFDDKCCFLFEEYVNSSSLVLFTEFTNTHLSISIMKAEILGFLKVRNDNLKDLIFEATLVKTNQIILKQLHCC